MRVLLSCLQDLRPHAIPSYRFWARYFRNGIVEAGHDLVEVPNVDWAEGCTPLSKSELTAWRDRTWTVTLSWIQRQLECGRPINLFLSYLYPQQVEAAAIQQIQEIGIPCVNFFCDNVREFAKVPFEFHSFDLHWVPEYEAIGMYRQAGVRHCLAPMPVWVPAKWRNLPPSEIDQITFIGSSDELRRPLICDAIQRGAPIKVGGAGWIPSASDHHDNRPKFSRRLSNQFDFIRRSGVSGWARKIVRKADSRVLPAPPAENVLPKITNTEYIRLTRESKITLGINRVPTFRRSRRKPLTYSRLRDLEAPMMGACYLTEWTAGLEYLYELGEEIETYKTAAELSEKVRLLTHDRDRRWQLRKRGQKRALTEHTVGKSLEKIAAAVGISAIQ